MNVKWMLSVNIYIVSFLSFVREINIFLCLLEYKSENTAAELNIMIGEDNFCNF